MVKWFYWVLSILQLWLCQELLKTSFDEDIVDVQDFWNSLDFLNQRSIT